MSTTASPVEPWLEEPAWDDHADHESYPNRLPKRLLDVAGAASLLLLAWPLMLLIALVVRFDSPGPILYRQVRVGRDRRRDAREGGGLPAGGRERRRRMGEGKPFDIIKFRTMIPNSEGGAARLTPVANERVTRAGRWLRASHLDELPQLWNVFRGDMSLVGPRPERPQFVQQYVEEMPGYRQRFIVKPGITGLAQLEIGYDRSLADVQRKLCLDLLYLRVAGPWTDLRLLLRTVPHVIAFDAGRSPPRRAPRVDPRASILTASSPVAMPCPPTAPG